MSRSASFSEVGPETRYATVAIVGLPNVGKSTLLNALVGEHLAITSVKGQTTRAPVVGLRTSGTVQLVFEDHPGLLDPRYLMHQAMREASLAALARADMVLHAHPATEGRVPPIAKLVPEAGTSHKPTAVVLTKSDLVDSRSHPRLENDHFLVSARDGRGLDALLAWCTSHAPVRDFRHDPDALSTQPMRFFAAEFVREAAFEVLRDELPYAFATEVDEYREGSDPLYIRVTAYVERERQRQIVIGHGGRTVKELGRRARRRLEALVGQRVYLDLWVKALPKWRSDPRQLARFGLPTGAPTALGRQR